MLPPCSCDVVSEPESDLKPDDMVLIKGPPPQDSVWGTDVPQDHKIWTITERVVLSLLSLNLDQFILSQESDLPVTPKFFR